MNKKYKYEISFILPCLNEELTIENTIKEIKKYIKENNINSEIIVVNNGCTDNSIEIAKKYNVVIVDELKIGYGNALRKGIEVANGKYIIMGDCDSTYDFTNLEPFIEKLRLGYDLVVGNRYRGGFEKGSTPISHYYGAKILSFIAKKKYNVNIGDFHCGLRAFDSKIAKNIKFKTEGMEFATEIIREYSKISKKIIEVPTILKKGNDKRKSKLRTVKDGLRHLIYIIRN